jgi:hypothetical protein
MASPRTAERPAIRDLDEGRARPYRERVAPYRRERREFGGHIQWEAVFFGLLAAIGLVASLIAMVLGGLVATGVADFREDAASLVDRMATGGGAIGVAILALGYMAGGYVAARMARFDGWRQGLGVWLLSVLLILAAAITAWIAGGELDPTKSITLPSNPIDEGPLHDSDVALAAVAVLVPLIFAPIGGVVGERFHRAVDRVGFEPEPAPDNERDLEPEPEEDPELDDEERTAEQEQETKPVP